MILGGQLGEFHSQLFYPAGILSPERTLAKGSDIGLHTGMYLEQARAITADLSSGGLVWHSPQDDTRMRYLREMVNGSRTGYFNVNGTPSHPNNSVRLEPTDMRNRIAGEVMAETPWSRTVDNPNNGLRGEQFNVSEMMANRMLAKAMTPNPLVVTEAPSDVLERGPAGWVPRDPTPGVSRPDTDESVRDVVFAVQREVPWPMPGIGTYSKGGVPLTSAIFTPLQGLLQLTKLEKKKAAKARYALRQRPLPAGRAPPGEVSGVNRQTGEIREGQVYDPDSIPRMAGSGKPHGLHPGEFTSKAHHHGLEPVEFARKVLREPTRHDGATVAHADYLAKVDRKDNSDYGATVTGSGLAGGGLAGGDLPGHHAEGQKGAGDMAGSDAIQEAHRNRHLQFGDVAEKAKLPAPIDPENLPNPFKDEAKAAQGGQSSAPASFVAEQTLMTRQTLQRARGAEVAAMAPLDQSNAQWRDWMKGQDMLPGARPTVGPPVGATSTSDSEPLVGGDLNGSGFKGKQRANESDAAFEKRKAAFESAQSGKKSEIDANDEDAHDRAQNAYRKTDEYKEKNKKESEEVDARRMSKIHEYENRPDQKFIRGLGDLGKNAISSAGKALGLGDNVGDKVVDQFKKGGLADKAAHAIKHGVNEAGKAVGLGNVADEAGKAMDKGLGEAGKVGNAAFKAVKGRDFEASDTGEVLGAAGKAAEQVGKLAGSGMDHYPPSLVKLLLEREQRRAERKSKKRAHEPVSSSGLA